METGNWKLETCYRDGWSWQTDVGAEVLFREATKKTPLDGASVTMNPMLGRRSPVSPRVWQPGCRL